MPPIPRTCRGAVIALLVAACSGSPIAPTTPPSTAASPSGTVPAPTPPIPAVAVTPSARALPVFTATEPLVLYGHLTGAGGGVFVMHPDGSGKTQLATDVLPGVHKRAAWSPDGQDVVFVDETTERLWIAHLNGRPTSPVATCMHGGCDFPAWSPDGTKIAYSRVESRVGLVGPASVGIDVIDLASGTVTEAVRFSRPTLADVPSWSPDGKQIVFQVDQMDAAANETGASLGVVPAAGGKVRYLTEFSVFASLPDWGWVTDRIVFSTDLMGAQSSLPANQNTWDVWVVKPDGSGLKRVTHLADGGRLKAPKWAPNGSAIFAYDLVAGQGVTIDPVTGAVTPYSTGQNGTRPSLRPRATP